MAPSEPKREPIPDSTSSSLLERARAQDDDAWRRLVDLYGPVVFRRARLALGDEHSANDVLQEVFRAVATAIASFDKRHRRGSFRSWLRTITLNKIRDHLRKHEKEPRAVGGTTAQAQVAAIAQSDCLEDQLSDGDEKALLLRQALETLRDEFEEHSIQAFLRTAESGLTSREVAEELGMMPAAVRQARVRVIRRLREELGDLLD